MEAEPSQGNILAQPAGTRGGGGNATTCSLEAEGGYVRGDEDPVDELGVEARYCGLEVAGALSG